MVTRGLTIVGLAALCAWLLPCSGRAAEGVSVVDDRGSTLDLVAPAKRIVSLSPHLTELLFEAGAEGSIVGADAHSDYPAAARRIPRVGDAYGIDLERLLRLRPDLVVAWHSGNSRKTLQRIRTLGIPVFESEPRRLDDIPATMERLGVLAGTQDNARTRADEFRHRLSALRARYAGKRPLRAFYEVWHRPLMTIGDDHLIADALATCGARSVLSGLKGVTATPAREAALLADPDVLVVASADPEALVTWQRWRQLRAVRTNAILRIDPQPMHRPTSRTLDALTTLCARIGELRGPSMGSAILAPGSATVGSMP